LVQFFLVFHKDPWGSRTSHLKKKKTLKSREKFKSIYLQGFLIFSFTRKGKVVQLDQENTAPKGFDKIFPIAA
jgi:hypothetical protein